MNIKNNKLTITDDNKEEIFKKISKEIPTTLYFLVYI